MSRPRCLCGAFLNRYTVEAGDKTCGPCQRTENDRWLANLRKPPEQPETIEQGILRVMSGGGEFTVGEMASLLAASAGRTRHIMAALRHRGVLEAEGEHQLVYRTARSSEVAA